MGIPDDSAVQLVLNEDGTVLDSDVLNFFSGEIILLLTSADRRHPLPSTSTTPISAMPMDHGEIPAPSTSEQSLPTSDPRVPQKSVSSTLLGRTTAHVHLHLN